ncbi:MAG: two-component system sensor histidine kinase/response regulator [Candidatus Pelagisphaera sp.]|jgi:two-component system sensor histidine kinase/response regulator
MDVSEDSIKKRRATKRVLVVEDHEYSARIHCGFLEMWGFGYERVSNGAEAVAGDEKQAFDAILMDVMMPKMDGYQATSRIVENAAPDRVPVIIGLTGNTMAENINRCRDVGMSKVMIKPIDFDRLRALLDEILFSEDEWEERDEFAYAVAKSGSKEASSRIIDEAVASAFVERMNSMMTRQGNPLDAFSHSLNECLAKLDRAVEENDFNEVEGCAHILKSIAGLVGARDLEDLSRGLEAAAEKRGPHFRPAHWLMLIHDAVKALKQVLMPS